MPSKMARIVDRLLHPFIKLLCMLEDHPTATWTDPNTDLVTCDRCKKMWLEKRPSTME